MRTRLFILRHAEAEGNLRRRFHGWTDSSITEKGRLQAQKAAERLSEEKLDVLISSPLLRTKQTAEYIANIKQMELIFEEGLKEIHGGDWEDKTWSELEEKWPKEYTTWDLRPHELYFPNGESMEEFQKRLIRSIERILSDYKGKTILIVTHGTAIKTLMCYFKGLPLAEMINIEWYENTALTLVEHENQTFEILLSGDDSHLSEELSTVRKQGWVEELKQKIRNHTGSS